MNMKTTFTIRDSDVYGYVGSYGEEKWGLNGTEYQLLTPDGQGDTFDVACGDADDILAALRGLRNEIDAMIEKMETMPRPQGGMKTVWP